MNTFLEFLPTVGLAMVVNLGRGYPDTVLAEKFLVHCWKPFSLHHLVVRLLDIAGCQRAKILQLFPGK